MDVQQVLTFQDILVKYLIIYIFIIYYELIKESLSRYHCTTLFNNLNVIFFNLYNKYKVYIYINN